MTITYHRNDKEEFSDRLTDLFFKCVNAPDEIVNYLDELLQSVFEIIKVAESQHRTISGYKNSLEHRDALIAKLKAKLEEHAQLEDELSHYRKMSSLLKNMAGNLANLFGEGKEDDERTPADVLGECLLEAIAENDLLRQKISDHYKEKENNASD